MQGPARLSSRSGVARSGASRSGALLSDADRMDDTVWELDDPDNYRRTIERQLHPSWTPGAP